MQCNFICVIEKQYIQSKIVCHVFVSKREKEKQIIIIILIWNNINWINIIERSGGGSGLEGGLWVNKSNTSKFNGIIQFN